ncbi:PAS domain-containing sensor histidine kinase [Alicyclobacillus mengziensis]|uniref:histidine kinase n=1 Tax=Alicyclobacillus mengziensis TaxID=2931921 RepID=A0A9X7Z680_9BACL|nr:PAS domain-containing sensor histidine kinase [Alicyclobacillus mengziensis]QSO46066.1 PAS domain S-box protein [Alicyclobacillus mengziensis]
MGSRLRWTKRTWLIVWSYAIIVPFWVIFTDFLYRVWTHQFEFRLFLFSSIRGVVLYMLTIWLLRYLIQRINAVQAHYQTLVEISPQPIFVQSASQKWVYVNPAGLKLIGATQRSDVIGHSVWEIVHPDDYRRAQDHMRKVHITGSPKNFATHQSVESTTQMRLIRLDGTVLEVECVAVSSHVNKVPIVQILYTDVTERNRMERERYLAVSELEGFMEHHTDGIAIFDADGYYSTLNGRFAELYQVTKECIVGRKWSDVPFVPRQAIPAAEQFIAQLLRGDSITGYRSTCSIYDGNLDVSISGFPLKQQDGTIHGFAVTIRDITEEKHAEERLIQSEKLAAVGQLAAGVAHEIRNPLTTVLGLLKLLPTSAPGKQMEYRKLMENELKRIASIATEMLSLAKPQVDDVHDVEVTKLLTEVFQFLEPEAAMRDVDMQLALPDSVETVVIRGQEQRLKQVLINLIRNAVDALGQAPRTIQIGADIAGAEVAGTDVVRSRVVMTVQDSGCGMSEEQLLRLATPFFTTKEHGTGLGLYVCRQIIEQHQGELHFQSKLGIGTTVSLTLPLYQVG